MRVALDGSYMGSHWRHNATSGCSACLSPISAAEQGKSLSSEEGQSPTRALITFTHQSSHPSAQLRQGKFLAQCTTGNSNNSAMRQCNSNSTVFTDRPRGHNVLGRVYTSDDSSTLVPPVPQFTSLYPTDNVQTSRGVNKCVPALLIHCNAAPARTRTRAQPDNRQMPL
jgi:hypothetical protein